MKCSNNGSNLTMIQLDPFSENAGSTDSGKLFSLI